MTARQTDPRMSLLRFGFVLVGLGSCGCGIDFAYLVPAAVGQLDLLQQAVPVEEALASGELTDEQAAKLRLIQDVRTYARDVLGLQAADNYTTIYLSGGEPVAFNVSASRKDAFVPVTWSFPIIGTVPYLGYFDRAAAEAKRVELAARGFDVFVYALDAYSGLGFYPNPILSPMLDRNETSLTGTVIHELLHNTVWRENDTPFNESLATFVGRAGAIGYFMDRYPNDPAKVQYAIESFEDVDRYSAFALELYEELDAFYASDLTSEQKIAGRPAVFLAGRDRFLADVRPLMNRPSDYAWVEEGLPINNAWMLGIRRYNLDLAVFEAVFEQSGQDWGAALGVFQSAAQAPVPYDYLRAWLGWPADTSTEQAPLRTIDGAAFSVGDM